MPYYDYFLVYYRMILLGHLNTTKGSRGTLSLKDLHICQKCLQAYESHGNNHYGSWRNF